MSETEAPPPPPESEEAVAAEPILLRPNRMRLSLVWIVPIVAVLIGAVLVVRSLMQTGPEITIEFRSADGIEARRTEVRFKEVVIGHVRRVHLRADHQAVLVVVGLDKSAANIAVEDTRFWIVRPRIGTGGVSGLSTLLSGAYIGVDAGASTEPRREFTGLENAPLVLRDEPGSSFVLQADDLGSLDVGSPVYHRRVPVGRVVGYSLDAEHEALQVRVFVAAPYDHLVTRDSRFWNASGIELSVGAGGLTVNTQSLVSVLAGGLAFADPPEVGAPKAAESGHVFKLFSNRQAAMAPDDGSPLRVRMVFEQSLRGLEVGAPIDLMGVEIGSVHSIGFESHSASERLPMQVTADLYPQRMGSLLERGAASGVGAGRADRQLLQRLVAHGLRAQVRTGNLLTGALYIALDFVPKAPPAALDVAAAVPTLPTVPGAFDSLQAQLAEIVGQLAKVKFGEIGGDLQTTLKTLETSAASLQALLADTDTSVRQLTPQAHQTLADVRQTLQTAAQTLKAAESTLRSTEANLADGEAPLQRSAAQTLGEMQRAAQALRVLADYLQRHPESLLRGKPADPDVGTNPSPSK